MIWGQCAEAGGLCWTPCSIHQGRPDRWI